MSGKDPVARALVESSLELHRRRLWQEVPGDAPFLIRVPGEEAPLVATIMGHLGSDYGLFLARGEDAFAQTVAIHRERGQRTDALELLSVLSVCIDPIGDIPPDHRGLLHDAGFHPSHDGLAPLALAKPAHRRPRTPNRAESRLLLTSLRAILAVHAAGEFEPKSLDSRRKRVFEIVVEGEGRDARFHSHIASWPEATAPPRVKLDTPWGDRDPELPRLQERWLAACAPFPIPISDGDDDREKALFIVVDEGSGRVIGAEPLPSADHEQIAAALGRYFRGENSDRRAGLPLEIAFASDELQKSLGEALRQFGITATVEPDPPALAEALRALDATFAKIAGSTKREQHRSRAPMPTTLTEWKEADLDFVRRLIQEVCHGRSPPPRAVTRFFGSHTVFNDVMDELEALQPMAGFMEWFFADYRATNRSLTLFERLLHGGRVTPLDRVLIQARIDARFSIFRIDSTEPGATLQVEDVITGARATIHDRAFSGCDIVGAYFPLRLIRLGEWDTCVVAGPPLSHVALDQFMQLLETMRVELTPEGMRRSSHLTGRLWDLELELRHHPNRPTLCNTDGEPLESHTATFHVADADAVERMLRARADLEFDEAGRSWCWSRPGGPAPGFGGTTVLARIEILGDRLVVEVNSRGRLERARQWIDRLPGVRFERASVREPFDDPSPLDDRLKTSAPQKAPDPELRKQLEKLQLQALRRWLDTPVPALRNLTPRAACATADGRRRVALMVRTLPAMGIPGGSIPPPRAELLRELGLDSAS